jgi:S1-C subfamily serine protease
MAIAIGNPFGYQHSVSANILSGKARTMQTRNGSKIEDVLQSHVPLNPGSSGGPLINCAGEVIGINTAVIYGANAISFAIAIDGIRHITDQLIKSLTRINDSGDRYSPANTELSQY